jgi:hypothetical protein
MVKNAISHQASQAICFLQFFAYHQEFDHYLTAIAKNAVEKVNKMDLLPPICGTK